MNCSPLSVGPIPSPLDPAQEEKAQETFEQLYLRIEKQEENEKFTSTEMRSNTKKSDQAHSEAVIVPRSFASQTQQNEIVEIRLQEENRNKTQETGESESVSIPISVDTTGPCLPPLEDPSVILLSLSRAERSDKPLTAHPTDQDTDTLADEVKHIKEDIAAEFLKEELKDKIVDMIAYQKHNSSEEERTVQVHSNHFQELREKEIEAQKGFHKKLLSELAKDPVEYKKSSVAEALGTKFEVKACQSSDNLRGEQQQYVHEQGSLSVPSKSPEQSRRGSFSDTYMSKGAFWSHSLPRTKRRVTFTDDLPPPPPPSRPPPPAPVRQQSISAMKELSGFSNTYNNVLQEKKQELTSDHTTSSINSLQSVEYRSYAKTRSVTAKPESDYKVDLGPQRDPWVELYGNSVLNNTLQDRLGKRGLQKSQSAVWTNSELTEHGPVLSTDRLEKPKKVSSQDTAQDSKNQHVVRPSPPSTGSLKRNTSMANLSRASPAEQASSEEASVQIPPSVVRGIVITVLQNQGITNPSEEILQKAIQEYYSKNPPKVS